MQLEFSAADHSYRLNGRPVVSVTQALAPLAQWLGPEDAVEFARVRGDLVHAACDLVDREELDWAQLDPQLVPYLEGYRNFLIDSDATVVASELRVASPQFGYAGRLDRLLAIKHSIALVDVKATAVVSQIVGPQTAAYAQAAKESAGHKRLRRYCLHLHPTHARGYKLTSLSDPADWSVFLSCLNVTAWRNRHAA